MTAEITAEEFDRLFDEGADLSEYLDWEGAYVEQPLRRHESVIVQFPLCPESVTKLDEVADREGRSRSDLLSDIVGAALATA